MFLFFQSYNALPHVLATTGHKLNLAGTAWFAIVMALLTWTMPGVNALLVRFRRPDLVRNAPFAKALPWLGLVWLVVPGVDLHLRGGQADREEPRRKRRGCTTSRRTASSTRCIFYGLGLVIYLVMLLRARGRQGVDTKMLFTEIPPD